MILRISPSTLVRSLALWWFLGFMGTGWSHAQVLEAFDDEFGIPFGEPLVVEAFGILDNDLLDGEAAGENGATAELVTDVDHGTLSLNLDGSFTYSPGASFDGTDVFVYRAVFAALSSEATVTLTACEGGPDIFTCWNETAFLAKAAEAGLTYFQEEFEDDAAWGLARSPLTLPVVNSQGIQWMTNHPGAPAFNEITTGSGPARTGQWGVYDPGHGYATGTPAECDVDVPPAHCLYFDGFSGIREPGLGVLHGVGGYLTGIYGANVGILLDGDIPLGGGKITGGHQFFGVIDTRTNGFNHFEFRELDGKVGQALYIFGDDFTILTSTASAVEETRAGQTRVYFADPGPNPSDGRTRLRFSTPVQAEVQLAIYDVRGRLVRRLADGSRGVGSHVVNWDGRDREGKRVPAGSYFGMLTANIEGKHEVQVRKMVITH